MGLKWYAPGDVLVILSLPAYCDPLPLLFADVSIFANASRIPLTNAVGELFDQSFKLLVTVV